MKKKINKTHRKEFSLGIILSFCFFLIISSVTFFAYSNSIRSNQYEKMDIISDNISYIIEKNFKEVFTISRTLFYSEEFQNDADIDIQNPASYQENLEKYLVNTISNLNFSVVSDVAFIPYSNQNDKYDISKRIYEGKYDGLFSVNNSRSLIYYNQIINQSLNEENDNGNVYVINQVEERDEFIIFARLVKQTFVSPIKRNLGIGFIVVSKTDFLKPLMLCQSLDGMGAYILDNQGKKIFSQDSNLFNDRNRYRIKEDYIDFYDYKFVTYYDTTFIYKEVIRTISLQFLLFLGLFILFALAYYLIQKNYRKNLNYLFKSFQFSANCKNVKYIALTNKNEEVDQVIQAYNNMVTSITNEKINNDILSEQNAKFEMKNLTTQINRHFIINILSVIHSLINLKEYEKSKYCIEILSDFLHYTLSLDKQEVDLNSEIVQIKNYLNLQSIRYKNIKVNYHIDKSLLNIVVPKMILQPLVENALVHGLPNKEGTIDIDVYQKEGIVFIKVANDGILDQESIKKLNDKITTFEKMDSKNNINHGVALINISRRLQLKFGLDASIYLQSDNEKVYSVITIKNRK